MDIGIYLKLTNADKTINFFSNLPTEHKMVACRYCITHMHSFQFLILTDLLTPWSRVLLEKLTGSQLVKKFPGFYGTRRFITAIIHAYHLSLS